MFMFILFFSLVEQAFVFVITPESNGCYIDVSHHNPEPVVVSLDKYQFLYPLSDHHSIYIRPGSSILISCPGGKLFTGSTYVNSTQATCITGTKFSAESKSLDFNGIHCSRTAFHTARYTGRQCESYGNEIEIGFKLDSTRFTRQIRICFDEENFSPLYSAYNLTRSIGAHESGVHRPLFIQDHFYRFNVNKLYIRRNQRATINQLVGLDKSSTKYVQNRGDYYLARGHLTAKADFVYSFQQNATFHYINAAPQWQTFNGQNWEAAESDVRIYADNNDVNLQVYTGLYGVATLPHVETGELVELYLHINEQTGEKSVPVPALYWKIAYDPVRKLGIALIGVNNPYKLDVQDDIICEDVSAQIQWLTWKAYDVEKGYSYACTVQDLRRVVKHVPNLDVRGLLV